MIDRRLLAMVGLALFTGCTLPANPLLPAPPLPKQWPESTDATAERCSHSKRLQESGACHGPQWEPKKIRQISGEAPTDRSDHPGPTVQPSDFQPPPWRTFYTQPVLQDVIATALESNRDLRVATARMEKARALLGLASSARLPTIQGELTHQTVRTPADLTANAQPATSRRMDMDLAMPAFEVDFWGRWHNVEAAAQATFLASDATIRAARSVLISQVVETFITWRELAERIAIAQTTLENQQELRELVVQRLKAGMATAQSQLLADIAVEGVRADLAELQRQAALLHNTLQLLTGTDLDPAQPWPGLTDMELTTQWKLALPAQVLAARPDVQAAEQRLRAADANIDAARAAFWPRVMLTTTVGTASRELHGLFQHGSGVWTFMPRLDIPIFDFSRRKNELAAAQAEQKALLAEYEKVLQQAFREVADALTSRGVLLDRLQALTATHMAQQEQVTLLADRFRVGVDGRQELLRAQQELYATDQHIKNVQRQILVNQVLLYKALGGGADP